MIKSFSDSDWAGNKSDRKSNAGYFGLFNDGFVTWKSYQQKCVAASSTETEFIALSWCVRQVRYVRNLLSELDHDVGSVQIYEYHQLCIAWAGLGGKRSKYVDFRYQIASEAAQNGEIEVPYCSSNEIPADALKQPLAPKKFRKTKPLIPIYSGSNSHVTEQV